MRLDLKTLLQRKLSSLQHGTTGIGLGYTKLYPAMIGIFFWISGFEIMHTFIIDGKNTSHVQECLA